MLSSFDGSGGTGPSKLVRIQSFLRGYTGTGTPPATQHLLYETKFIQPAPLLPRNGRDTMRATLHGEFITDHNLACQYTHTLDAHHA